MIDRTTGLPLRVEEGTVGPYVRLPFDQLAEIKRVLESHRLHYTVREDIISLSGGPFIAVVDLGRGTDAEAVQTILDGVV